MSTAISPFRAGVQPVVRQLTIRRLDPAQDEFLIEHAFSWLLNSPIWRQNTEEVFGTLNYQDYLAAHHDSGRVGIAVFEGKYHRATVTLHLTAKHTYEVSLEADRATSLGVLMEAGRLIRDQLFGLYNAELVYAWVPMHAVGVRAVLTSIGFTTDRVTMLRGVTHSRLIEWELYSLRRGNE